MFQENTALDCQDVKLSEKLDSKLNNNEKERIFELLNAKKKQVISNCNSGNKMIRDNNKQIVIIGNRVVLYGNSEQNELWNLGGHLYANIGSNYEVIGVCYQVKLNEENKWKVLEIPFDGEYIGKRNLVY